MSRTLPWTTFLKLVLVLALAVLLFFVHSPPALGALLGVELVLWIVARLPARALWRSVYRLRIFFLFIFLSYAFFSTGNAAADHWLHIPLGSWSLPLNAGGLLFATLMCLRVLILVVASAWMQRSSAPGTLVDALRMLRLPDSLAITVDAALALVAAGGGRGDGKGQSRGEGRGAGHGSGRGRAREDSGISLRALRRGELGSINGLIDRSLLRAKDYLRERYPDLGERALHDLTIVLAVTIAVMGLKIFQVLPGIPIASGHKNMVVVPLLLFAATATHMRFGGFLTGTAVGVVSFLLGYGKYGVLEISHFAVPGLLADLLLPLLRASSRGGRLLQYALAGLVLGAGRFAANLLVILLAGAPLPAFVLFAPMLISQLAFGALSCFASILIVNKTRFPDTDPGAGEARQTPGDGMGHARRPENR